MDVFDYDRGSDAADTEYYDDEYGDYFDDQEAMEMVKKRLKSK